jgi:WD40 repeat protein
LSDPGSELSPTILRSPYAAPHTIAVSKTADAIAAAPHSGGHSLYLWQLAEGRWTRREFEGVPGYVASLSLSPSGKFVVARTQEANVELFDSEVAESKPQVFQEHQGVVNHLIAGPHSQFIVGSSDGNVRRWKLNEDGRLSDSRAVHHHASPLNILKLGPKGRWLVLAYDDGRAWVCDLQSDDPSSEVIELAVQQAILEFIVFHDGNLVTG